MIVCLWAYVTPFVAVGTHVRGSVKEHDMHCGSKSCKLKLLGFGPL